jgi:hypothetical protein
MKAINFEYPTIFRAIAVIASSIIISSCYSQKTIDDYAETRRQTLLEMYPPRVTTKKDVGARWKVSPDVNESRPASGWIHIPKDGFGPMVPRLRSESDAGSPCWKGITVQMVCLPFATAGFTMIREIAY